MSSHNISEDKTRRMVSPSPPTPTPSSPPLPEDKTRRMEARSAAASGDQDLVATSQVRSTKTADDGYVNSLGALPSGAVLCGDCVVVQTHHNHESGRPGLFECQSPEGRVMVKIAATDFPPQADLWSKLATFSHPNVLRTFRTVEAEGRFYEVQEFCSAGTFADYVPLPGSGRTTPSTDWIERSLVPAFHAGISYLHGQGLVHRDIKPSNLYMKQSNGRNTLVIGDFDISSVLQSGRTSRSTQRAAGTWIYSAPEAFPRFVDEGASTLGAAVVRSSDFYSFGVVIVEMLLGTTSLHQAQLSDLYDFYLQGGRVKIPDGLPARLSELLSGLLCRNRNLRWGAEEVGRWIQKQTTDADRRRIVEDRGFELNQGITPFNAFDKSQPTNLAQLSQAIVAEPKVALDELMSSDVMLNWIGQIDARIARQIRKDREQWRAHPSVALVCARLRIDPAASLSVDASRTADSAEEWAKWAQVAVAKGTVNISDLCHREKLLELETWLRLKAAPELDAAANLARISARHEDKKPSAPPAAPAVPAVTPPESKGAPTAKAPNYALILEEISYAFLSSKPYLVAPNLAVQTPAEIARSSMGDAKAWGDKPPACYLASAKRWQDGFLEAYLRQRVANGADTSPLLQQMQKLRQDFKDKPFVAFEVILRLIDPTLPPLEVEFDPRVLEQTFEAPHGTLKTLELPYRTKGAGMPFAAVQLQCQWAGLRLGKHEITHRQGTIQVILDAHGDMPSARDLEAKLSLAGKTTLLAGSSVPLNYRVVLPQARTMGTVIKGALIGGALLGGTRLALTLFVPRALRFGSAASLNSGAWIFVFLITTLMFYIAFRIWMRAVADNAR